MTQDRVQDESPTGPKGPVRGTLASGGLLAQRYSLSRGCAARGRVTHARVAVGRGAHRRRLLLASLALFFTGGLLAGEGHAQVVTGTVVDQIDRRPLEGVRIEVRSTEGELAAATLSDAQGRFVISFSGGEGPWRFEAAALGYLERALPAFRVPAGDTLRLVEVPLERRPILLDTLSVERRRGSILGVTPGWVKLRERQAEGRGIFLSGAMIMARKPPSLTQFLSELQDLHETAGDSALAGRTELRSSEGRGCMRIRVNEWMSPAQAFVDSIDELDYESIAAVEIYTSFADVPDDLAHWAHPCGLVNIWFWGAYCGSTGCPGQGGPARPEEDPLA